MTFYQVGSDLVFPPPEWAEANGLIGVGGDLEPQRLVQAYSQGIFPWYENGVPILWFSPDPRTVLLPRKLHLGRSLRRALRVTRLHLTLDTAFDRVIRACAECERPDQSGTWITADMIDAYQQLHRVGIAHSSEAWADGVLVGGLYGVALGGVFFGESMFALSSNASKISFVALVLQLLTWGFGLIDCQIRTHHLARFGAEDWPRRRFLELLGKELERPTRTGPWSFEGDPLRTLR